MKILPTSMLLCLLLVNACAMKGQTTTESDTASSTIKNIAILPVVSKADKSNTMTYSYLKTQERGVEALTQIIHDYFAEHNNITILNDEKVESFDINYTANRTAQALSIAKNLGADAVMMVTMNRFTERDGGKYSVQQPASVAFAYTLLQSDNGQTLCSGVFDETQKSLTDNLLSFKSVFKRKLQWVTAKEFASDGLSAKFDSCKYLQKPAAAQANQ